MGPDGFNFHFLDELREVDGVWIWLLAVGFPEPGSLKGGEVS